MVSRIVLRRMALAAFAVAGVMFLGAAAMSAAPERFGPGPDPSSPVVEWVERIAITPSAPPVGTYYTVTGTVRSRHYRPLMLRAEIMVPPMDRAVEPVLTRRIEPYGTLGFMWNVYCGEPGGDVRVKVDIVQEL
jgi:hypothetical protein